MKSFLTNIVKISMLVAMLYSANSVTVFAQWDVYTGTDNPTYTTGGWTTYGTVGCSGCTDNTNIITGGWTTYNGVDNSIYGQGYNTYGTVGCSGCTSNIVNNNTNGGWTTYTGTDNTVYGQGYNTYGTVGCSGCTSNIVNNNTTANTSNTTWYGPSSNGNTTWYGPTTNTSNWTDNTVITTPLTNTWGGYTGGTYTTGYTGGYTSTGGTINVGNIIIGGGTTGGAWGTTCPNGTTLINNSCVINNTTCPNGTTLVNGTCQITNITCPNGTTLVNGSCVVNNTQCPTGTTLVNGTCVQTNTQCPAGTTLVNGSCVVTNTQCPTGSTLVNGTCVLNNTTCPTGSTLVNGSCVVNNTTCPTGSTLVNGTCQINNTNCPTGSTLVNGTCVLNNTQCPSGSTLVNGTCQINNTTCPPNSTLINGVCQAPISCPTGTTYTNGVCQGTGQTVCPSGSSLVNGICQITTTQCPAGSSLINGICQISSANCPNGTTYTGGLCYYNTGTYYGGSYTNYGSYNLVSYQTCWNGTTIPNNQVCPSQYKTCGNGTVVPMNQVCYQVCPDGTSVLEGGVCYGQIPRVPAPTVVKFNNVVTSVATEITNKSGRCNGIGLIANGAQSTGWFEYGETANLGKTTSPVAIGQAVTAPFSNLLTNLKPSTSYYCRAVMNNQYGTVKGEIVRFTTKAKAVTYVAPAPVKKPVQTKKPVRNEIICADGTTVKVGSQGAVTLLNQGQKLVTIQVEKVQGDLAEGNTALYRIVYKNISDTELTNLSIAVTIPQEFTFVGSTQGNFDPNTNTLALGVLKLDPFTEGVVTWTVKVKQGVEVGKSVVTTGYLAYTLPNEGKADIHDEVTGYAIGTIVPKDNAFSSGDDISLTKHVIGAGSGSFFPQSLVEWLALVAIIFIIAILARSVYIGRKGHDAHAH